jgi:hypothetical protein
MGIMSFRKKNEKGIERKRKIGKKTHQSEVQRNFNQSVGSRERRGKLMIQLTFMIIEEI